jgi:hypothetical protein
MLPIKWVIFFYQLYILKIYPQLINCPQNGREIWWLFILWHIPYEQQQQKWH